MRGLWTFVFHKLDGICRAAERHLSSQNGRCLMEVVDYDIVLKGSVIHLRREQWLWERLLLLTLEFSNFSWFDSCNFARSNPYSEGVTIVTLGDYLAWLDLDSAKERVSLIAALHTVICGNCMCSNYTLSVFMLDLQQDGYSAAQLSCRTFPLTAKTRTSSGTSVLFYRITDRNTK
jgi:hypothetical protein